MIKLVKYEDVFYKEMLNLSVFDDQVSFIEDIPSTIIDYHSKAYGIDWIILMIHNDDQLVGYVMYGLNSGHDLWIDRFLIDKSYQHQGIGKMAFKAVIEHLKASYQDVSKVLLSVNIKNLVASLFYQSMGFVATSEFDGLEPVYAKRLNNK